MSEIKLRGQSARSPQDMIGGLVLVALSVLALYLVRDLPASGRVGFASGTAPRLCAYGLLVLGAFISVKGFMQEGPALEGFGWRGLATILGSVLLFAVMIRTFGLAVTGIPVVILASLAAHDFKLKEGIIFAAGITGFCALLFPIILGQPIPLWPTFL